MKSVLINPYSQTIETVEIKDGEGLSEYYRLIGCDCVEHVALTDTDGIFIDDKGMLKQEVTHPSDPHDTIPQAYFIMGNGVVIAGIALVVAVDDEGNTVESRISEAYIKHLFEHGGFGWDWLDTPEQAMEAVREQQRAAAEAYRAAGYDVELCGDLAFVATKD